MQRAVDAVERTVVREHDIRIRAAVEMLGDRLFEPRPDTGRKRLPDLDLLA